MKRNGFTLVELILLITILGIIAISALPRFLDLTEKSEEAHRDAVVGAVRAGIAMYHARHLGDAEADSEDAGAGSPEGAAWPPRLDDAESGACTDCFSAVIDGGVSDRRWSKDADDTSYTFTTAEGDETIFRYDPATGSFHRNGDDEGNAQ